MKILIASKIDPDAIETLKENHEVVCAFNAKEDVLKAEIRDCDILVFRSGVKITADVMSAAPNLKLLIRAGSGLDNLDVNYVNQRELQLIRVPGPGAKAVAEMTFALFLALARNLMVADRLTREGHWAKNQLNGQLLTGKVLGVVGAGNIGSVVAHLGVAWGMKVLACVEHYTPQREEKFKREGIQLTTCEQVLAQSDFVSVHVPRKESNLNLINEKTLAYMKPGAFLVNIARGGIVDEAALYQALTEGRLAGAALDVHTNEGEGKVSPLAGLDNVILTPHIGANTIDSQREIGEIVVESVEALKAELDPVLVKATR